MQSIRELQDAGHDVAAVAEILNGRSELPGR